MAHILIVDDDRDMLALMAHALSKAGHETCLALDAIAQSRESSVTVECACRS